MANPNIPISPEKRWLEMAMIALTGVTVLVIFLKILIF